MAPPIRKTKFNPQWIDMGPKIPVPKIDWIEEKRLDIPYGDDPLQRYDLYYPAKKASTPLPVLVIVHGGGFMHMDKRDWHMYPGFFALEKGFALISINYRLAPKNRYPEGEEDVANAILHIKEHAAEWGLDPEKICLYGTSAGGNLVSIVGLKAVNENAPYNVRAVAALCPFLSFDWLRDSIKKKDSTLYRRLVLPYICLNYFGRKNWTEKRKLASAENYIEKTIPPFYLQSGTNDPAIDHRDVIRFYEQLAEAENATSKNLVLDVMEGAPHAGAGPEYLEPQNILPILEFFENQF
ncbi:MAG: alpha/beta hydrolase [Oscillospiraceae bacterium]